MSHGLAICVIVVCLYRWKPPRYIWTASQGRHERIRKKWHILTEGEDIPPPIKTFKVKTSIVNK